MAQIFITLVDFDTSTSDMLSYVHQSVIMMIYDDLQLTVVLSSLVESSVKW